MPNRRRASRKAARTSLGAVGAIVLLLLVAVVAADRLGLGTGAAVPPPSVTAAAGRVAAQVLRIIDGDTIEVDVGGETHSLRYIGVDAPELHPSAEPYGVAATEANAALVAGKTVYLEKDVSETDRYGRLLRYVWLDDVMVNEELVRQGMARVGSYPPDTGYHDRLLGVEAEARAAGRGLWADVTPEPSATPRPTPAGSCPEGCATPPAGCDVKGNISSDGRRRYHLPGEGSYDSTKIDPDAGERWFCTAAEAEAAGWSGTR
ncbi:MAG: thermonuclease family protein [Anaerolineae bacterium]